MRFSARLRLVQLGAHLKLSYQSLDFELSIGDALWLLLAVSSVQLFIALPLLEPLPNVPCVNFSSVDLFILSEG